MRDYLNHRRPVTAEWLREIAARCPFPDVAAYLEARAVKLERVECPHCGATDIMAGPHCFACLKPYNPDTPIPDDLAESAGNVERSTPSRAGARPVADERATDEAKAVYWPAEDVE